LGGGPVVTSPPATLKTVCRRADGFGASAFLWCVAVGGGGGTEKRARSWASVSRIREVMSGLESRALVKIFGGGKLHADLVHFVYFEICALREVVELTEGCQCPGMIWRSAPGGRKEATFSQT
jgi:hypothetical protein